MNQKLFKSVRELYIKEFEKIGARVIRDSPIYEKGRNGIKCLGLDFELDTVAGILNIYPGETYINSKFKDIDKAKSMLPHGWHDRLSVSGKYNFNLSGECGKDDLNLNLINWFISDLRKNGLI